MISGIASCSATSAIFCQPFGSQLSRSSSGAVTNGIGHSLLATGCGLLVAIAGVAANSYFSKRVRLALLELDLIKLVFIKQHCLLEESIVLRHNAEAHPAGQGKATPKRTAEVVYAGAAS